MGGKRPGRGAPAKRSVPAVLAAEGAGVGLRRHPAELRMWPLLVVITPPGLQYGTGVRRRFEQRLVQQLIAEPAVEAFDEAVLLRFAGRDVVPADAGRIRPAQDRVRGQLGAVVANDGVRASATPANDVVEFTRIRHLVTPAPMRSAGGGSIHRSKPPIAVSSTSQYLPPGAAASITSFLAVEVACPADTRDLGDAPDPSRDETRYCE